MNINKCNNTLGAGADPWVVEAGGKYYYISANGHNAMLTIQKAEHLYDITKSESHAIWTPPENTEYSKELWAPELHYVFGRWYVYVAADDGNNDNHRMYVLEGGTNSNNPLCDDFVFKGKISDSTNKWAIDGTVIMIKDEPYFVWSGWEKDENIAQFLYIAKMLSPYTLGERVKISEPELEWECRGGNPLINEGPSGLYSDDGTVHIIYSASGSWSDFYCLGMLTLTGENPLEPDSWAKYEKPVFESTENTFAPGHASFVKTPVEKENWIIFHTAKNKGSGWDRIVRIQKFDFIDNVPHFGNPLDKDTQIDAPLS